jgi:NADH-quinone oxidoreductase subunit K
VTGQVFTLFIMGLAAAEAAIVLALIIAMYRNYQSVNTSTLNELKG